tara:strand:+ start:101 stop:292 length:192 start_codon:yes stop_codon:yes gene_type:complete
MFGWLRNLAIYILVVNALNTAVKSTTGDNYLAKWVNNKKVEKRFNQAQGVAALLVILLRDQSH